MEGKLELRTGKKATIFSTLIIFWDASFLQTSSEQEYTTKTRGSLLRKFGCTLVQTARNI